MGQYYMAMIEDENGERTTFDCRFLDRYCGLKLMEHSWWDSSFVNSICTTLYDSPCKVAWVGDYADDEFELYEQVWGDGAVAKAASESPTKLDGKYLVDHTTREYVDCDSYKAKSIQRDGWCIHPLPLLTCVGNGRGGGDYRSKVGKELVGIWCWHKISVEDQIPDGYEELDCCFREN